MKQGKGWTKKEVADYYSDLTAVTVPVNVTFEGKQKILSMKQVERLLKGSKRIAITDCLCRARVRGCDAPLDICLYLDKGADEVIESGEGKPATIAQAIAALRRGNDAGLVHIAYSNRGETKPIYICSCCSCCCHSFAAMQKFGFSEAVVSSDMIACQNDELCDDCGICADRCHFRARRMSDGKLIFEKSKCAGCGLCVTSCPNDAVSLIER